MPKFFVANKQIQGNVIKIIGEDVNHIANVLRLGKQDTIFVCDKDNGVTYKSEIIDLAKEEVMCQMIEAVEESTESSVKVTIFQGLPKADKMEYIIQKTTELGASEVVPVKMERCVVKLDGKDASKKIERWQKIAEVAAKQSGRDRIPTIQNIVTFQEVEETIANFDLFLVAYEEEKEVTLKQALQTIGKIGTKDIVDEEKRKEKIEKSVGEIIEGNQKENVENVFKEGKLKIGVLIGPEGGLAKEEVEKLKDRKAQVITLGKRILRTETAPITIVSNIMYEFDT